MKITVSQLRRIIKEEASRVLRESTDFAMQIPEAEDYAARMGYGSPQEMLASPLAVGRGRNKLNLMFNKVGEDGTLLVHGTEADLNTLAMNLDDMLVQAGESTDADFSFRDLIEPM